MTRYLAEYSKLFPRAYDRADLPTFIDTNGEAMAYQDRIIPADLDHNMIVQRIELEKRPMVGLLKEGYIAVAVKTWDGEKEKFV